MSTLTRLLARRIVESVGSNGIPPLRGLEFFTAGIDPYVSAIRDEYLSSYIKEGGSAFKMVVGAYGGGKTHFLYCIRDLAWCEGFDVSYVSLSPQESPFHKLELVYRAVVHGLVSPFSTEEQFEYQQGIENYLRTWYGSKFAEYTRAGISRDKMLEELQSEMGAWEAIDSISFRKAIKSAVLALHNADESAFGSICQWLGGEGYDRKSHSRWGILQRIDRTTAFTMLRSLAQWIRQIGHSGLVILLDEGERVPSLGRQQRELHLSNLREVIDECGRAAFQGVMIFYAVPDANFLEGSAQVYQALKQRLATAFEAVNPSGVQIDLQKGALEPIDFLTAVGRKLADVYGVAFDVKLEAAALDQTIGAVANSAYDQRFGDIGYTRLFVQKLIPALHVVRIESRPPSEEELK